MAQLEIEHGYVDLGADRLRFARTRVADAARPTLFPPLRVQDAIEGPSHGFLIEAPPVKGPMGPKRK